MEFCVSTLEALGIPCEVRVLSAHRTPHEAADFAQNAEARGIEVLIAAAGGAAHLAGVVASMTTLPVLGIPMKGWSLDGLDSLLSTVQMPGDVPVVSVAVGMGGPRNAGLFAVQILATADAELKSKLADFKKALVQKIEAKDRALQDKISGG